MLSKVSLEIYDITVQERLGKIDNECKNVVRIAKNLTEISAQCQDSSYLRKYKYWERFWRSSVYLKTLFLWRTGHKLMSIEL